MPDGRKISELNEETNVTDEHFFPVSDGNETRKVSFGTLIDAWADALDYDAIDERIDDDVDTWLTNHPEATTTVETDKTLTVVDMAADAKAVGDLVGIAERNTQYNTSAPTGYTISANRRWFLNGVSYNSIKSVSLRSKYANRNVKVEVWEVDGSTLTKAFEVSSVLVTAYAWNDIIINYASEKPMMISLQADSDAVNQITDTTKEFNAYYTADIASDTLNIGSLNSFAGLCVLGYAIYTVSIISEIDDRVSALENALSTDGVTTVMKSGNGDYSNIADAVAAASDGDTILVYPGTYTEPIEAWGKTINIVGVDKNSCVILNDTANYSTPAVEIDSGRIANLTILSTGDNPTCDATNTENYMRDYTIHVDNAHAAGKTLIIEDCIIRNNHRAALGMGGYANNTVVVRNCDIWANVPPSNITAPLWNKRGAVYLHNRAPSAYFSNVTGQKMRFIGNTIYCEDIIALYIGDTCQNVDMEGNGWVNEMEVEFINNMVCAKYANGSYKTSSDGVATPTAFANDSIIGGTGFTSHVMLSGISYGNNVDGLNA